MTAAAASIPSVVVTIKSWIPKIKRGYRSRPARVMKMFATAGKGNAIQALETEDVSSMRTHVSKDEYPDLDHDHKVNKSLYVCIKMYTR
jgi:hypothetical protein